MFDSVIFNFAFHFCLISCHLSYDIEKQEVIELPIKYESVPIEMNNGQPTASQPPPLITKVQATEEPSKEYPTISDQPKENTLKYEDTPKEELPEENVTLFDVRSAQFLYDDAKDK